MCDFKNCSGSYSYQLRKVQQSPFATNECDALGFCKGHIVVMDIIYLYYTQKEKELNENGQIMTFVDILRWRSLFYKYLKQSAQEKLCFFAKL